MLSCDCDNLPEIFRQKIQKARKQHFCCECGKQIDPGTDYEYVFGVWEGEADQFHTCIACADLRTSMYDLGFCSTFSKLHADCADYIAYYQPQKMIRNDK